MALFQALYIMVGTTLIFGVRWGAPVPALVLMSLFAAVSAAAGLLLGAQLRNQAQANGVAVFVGLSLAALGGCMLPMEIMPETLRTIAHVTPHAWALDGFADVVRRDGTVADILPELGALMGFLVVLLSLGGWRLRVALSK
jgi:ABC-2 type transport system permease protein